MDEKIDKLLRYLNTNYEVKNTVPALCSNGFNEQVINEAKRMGFIDVTPLVKSTKQGGIEDARVCKLTKEGILFVNNLKNRKEPVINVNSPVITGVEGKNEVNINYGNQDIHKHIVDKSINYEIDKQDVTIVKHASIHLIGKYGEKKIGIVGVVSLLAGLAEIFTWMNSQFPNLNVFTFLPKVTTAWANWLLWGGIIFLAIGIFLISIIAYRRSSQCKKCKSLYAYEETGTPTVREVKTPDGRRITTTRTYTCKYCGDVDIRKENDVIEKSR